MLLTALLHLLLKLRLQQDQLLQYKLHLELLHCYHYETVASSSSSDFIRHSNKCVNYFCNHFNASNCNTTSVTPAPTLSGSATQAITIFCVQFNAQNSIAAPVTAAPTPIGSITMVQTTFAANSMFNYCNTASVTPNLSALGPTTKAQTIFAATSMLLFATLHQLLQLQLYQDQKKKGTNCLLRHFNAPNCITALVTKAPTAIGSVATV